MLFAAAESLACFFSSAEYGRGKHSSTLIQTFSAARTWLLHLSCSQVAAHIGLDQFDFLPAVAKGKYNVEGHEGYDKVTDWDVCSA